jgi:hypothetical protein
LTRVILLLAIFHNRGAMSAASLGCQPQEFEPILMFPPASD